MIHGWRGVPWLSSENRPILVVIFFHPWDAQTRQWGQVLVFWRREKPGPTWTSPGGGRIWMSVVFFFWDHSSPVMFRTRSLDKETMNWCRVQVAKALSLDFWQTDTTHGFCGSLVIVEFHWSRSRGKGKGWIQFWGVYLYEIRLQQASKH